MYRETLREFLIDSVKYCIRLVLPGLVALLYYQLGKMEILSKLETIMEKHPLTHLEMINEN